MKLSANNGTHNHTTAPQQSGHNTTYVTGFVKIDPNYTGTEIHFIIEH